MPVPKCRECESHHHDTTVKTTINISETKFSAKKTKNNAHYCCHHETLIDYGTSRWIPSRELAKSPSWCPLRKKGE